MNQAYLYHVDENGQSVRIRLLSKRDRKRVKVRVVREWVSALLISLVFSRPDGLGRDDRRMG
jgi:hypothetical protein